MPHSYSADGVVRFGDSIMLRVSHTDPAGGVASAALACNLWDLVDRDRNLAAVTAAPGVAAPIARAVFTVTPPKAAKAVAGAGAGRLTTAAAARALAASRAAASSTSVLRYGDRFCLSTNASLRLDERTGMYAPPYVLFSEATGATVGSGGDPAAAQRVCVSLANGPGAEWRCVPADGDVLAAAGREVRAGEPVTIIHCATNQALSAVAGDFSPYAPHLCLSP